MNILLSGYGFMSKKVAHAIREHKDMNLIGIVSIQFDEATDEPQYSTFDQCTDKVDAIIDFSHPNNLDSMLKYALENKCALVIATTGFSDEQIQSIKEASKFIPIFQSYNTSFGISMMMKIVKDVCQKFYEGGYDIEILETHHNQKIDAPSGTAKLLYETIHEQIPQTHESYDRSHKREKEEVGIQSLRAGTIFGEHSVFFAGHDEIIEIKHTALSKEVFVQGAIQACLKIVNEENGYFTLKNLY